MPQLLTSKGRMSIRTLTTLQRNLYMPQLTNTQPPLLALVISAALIATVVSFSVDAEALNSSHDDPAIPSLTTFAEQGLPPFEPPSLAPSAIVLNAVPAYRSEQGMVKFFFAPSKTEVPANTERALQDVLSAVKNGQRVQIAGFHDTTGNPKINTELAQKRAKAIRQKLLALGAPAHAIEMRKPAVATDSGNNHAESRRVEVALLQ
jgi:outer membrane protein OmpA-like peptidoglycan-associated protein